MEMLAVGSDDNIKMLSKHLESFVDAYEGFWGETPDCRRCPVETKYVCVYRLQEKISFVQTCIADYTLREKHPSWHVDYGDSGHWLYNDTRYGEVSIGAEIRRIKNAASPTRIKGYLATVYLLEDDPDYDEVPETSANLASFEEAVAWTEEKLGILVT